VVVSYTVALHLTQHFSDSEGLVVHLYVVLISNLHFESLLEKHERMRQRAKDFVGSWCTVGLFEFLQRVIVVVPSCTSTNRDCLNREFTAE